MWTVIHWPVERISLAMLAMVLADNDQARRLKAMQRNKAMIFPTVVVGTL